jgi:hypothetical protein
MPNGRCRIHGGSSLGAPKGNKNAFKHGLHSAEAIAHRRRVGALLQAARKLVRAVKVQDLTGPDWSARLDDTGRADVDARK